MSEYKQKPTRESERISGIKRKSEQSQKVIASSRSDYDLRRHSKHWICSLPAAFKHALYVLKDESLATRILNVCCLAIHFYSIVITVMRRKSILGYDILLQQFEKKAYSDYPLSDQISSRDGTALRLLWTFNKTHPALARKCARVWMRRGQLMDLGKDWCTIFKLIGERGVLSRHILYGKNMRLFNPSIAECFLFIDEEKHVVDTIKQTREPWNFRFISLLFDVHFWRDINRLESFVTPRFYKRFLDYLENDASYYAAISSLSWDLGFIDNCLETLINPWLKEIAPHLFAMLNASPFLQMVFGLVNKRNATFLETTINTMTSAHGDAHILGKISFSWRLNPRTNGYGDFFYVLKFPIQWAIIEQRVAAREVWKENLIDNVDMVPDIMSYMAPNWSTFFDF